MLTSPAHRLPDPTTVVFDLGGVVLEWNPEHLYAHLIPDLDDSSRAAVAAVLLDCAADYMRTKRSLGG